MKKKTLAIAVATAMMMSIVACGSGDSADHTNTTETANAEVTETVDVTAETQDITVTDDTAEDVKTDSTVESKPTETPATDNMTADTKTDTSKSDNKQTQSDTKTDTSKSDSKQTQTDTKKPAETKPVHTHRYTCKVTKNATCSTKGVKTYTCSCGASYTEEIAKTAHNYNSGKVTKNPTCTSKGVKTYTCNGCGATYTEEIGVTSHSWKHYDAEYKTVTVTVQEAYDEDKYEEHVICGGCGMDFGMGPAADDAAGEHIMSADFYGPCQNYHTELVVVGTIHHDAVTERRQELVHAAYDKCTTCGKTK